MPYKDPQQAREYGRKFLREWRSANPERARANDKRYADSHKAERNAAQAARYYRRQYGMTREEVDALIVAQGFKCAICGEENPDWNTDHDHATGVVRGMLCRLCRSEE